MTEARADFIKKNAKLGLLGLGVVLAVGYFVGVQFFEAQQGMKRRAPDPLIAITGLPKATQIKTSYQNKDGLSTLAVGDDGFSLSPEQKKDFSVPYKIVAVLTDASGKYKDISWSIDKYGKSYNVRIDGLNPDDKITFKLNDIVVIDNGSVDWSGKISLHYVLLRYVDTNACLEIKNASSDYSFCHMLTLTKEKA